MTAASSAHQIVSLARRAGDLEPQPCERCGARNALAHHRFGYEDPLIVVWLCPAHHGAEHRRRAVRPVTFGEYRRSRGLSITQLAGRSGVPRSIVGLIDQGRLIASPDEAAALLAVLDTATAVA